MDSKIPQTIRIENEIYTISSLIEEEDKWKILLTNLVELFIERITREQILLKCQVTKKKKKTFDF